MSTRLDIDALRALKAISDTGGVTRAAASLALSQSAVSHRVRRLEDSIDCPLLSRRPGAPLLTEAGAQLARYAERILSLHDEALQALSKRTLAGKIRLGVTEDTTNSGLARILARFAQLHPGVAVRTHVAPSLTLARQLQEGAADLAVMQVFASEIREGDAVLFEERLHWVKSPDLRLRADKPIPLLAFDGDCFFRHWATETGEGRFDIVLECASTAGICAAIEAGMGVALLNDRHVTDSMEIVEERFPAPPAVAHIVRRCARASSAAVHALMQEITRASRRLAPPRAS